MKLDVLKNGTFSLISYKERPEKFKGLMEDLGTAWRKAESPAGIPTSGDEYWVTNYPGVFGLLEALGLSKEQPNSKTKPVVTAQDLVVPRKRGRVDVRAFDRSSTGRLVLEAGLVKSDSTNGCESFIHPTIFDGRTNSAQSFLSIVMPFSSSESSMYSSTPWA